MEVYIKGKFVAGVGSAAYVVVGENKEIARGSKRLGNGFYVDGLWFSCDQFNTEILAAICGLARCGENELVNIYSNNKSVIAWLSKGREPEERKELMDVYRKYAAGKDVFVSYIPFFTKDETENPWNELCNTLAEAEL